MLYDLPGFKLGQGCISCHLQGVCGGGEDQLWKCLPICARCLLNLHTEVDQRSKEKKWYLPVSQAVELIVGTVRGTERRERLVLNYQLPT